MPDHKVGMKVLLDTLQDEKIGVISDINEISAIGHRVVAGGEKYNKAVIVDDNVVEDILELAEIAPLHNKGAVMGINAIRRLQVVYQMLLCLIQHFTKQCQTIIIFMRLIKILYK